LKNLFRDLQTIAAHPFYFGHYTQNKIDGWQKFVNLQKYFLILSISVQYEKKSSGVAKNEKIYLEITESSPSIHFSLTIKTIFFEICVLSPFAYILF
jgi:hypothetical protein